MPSLSVRDAVLPAAAAGVCGVPCGRHGRCIEVLYWGAVEWSCMVHAASTHRSNPCRRCRTPVPPSLPAVNELLAEGDWDTLRPMMSGALQLRSAAASPLCKASKQLHPKPALQPSCRVLCAPL